MKVAKQKKTKVERVVPTISKEEMQATAETRLLNFLDTIHRGQKMPPEIKKKLLSQAESIYGESRERAEERFKFAENSGVLPSRGQKLTIWKNEFRKTAIERLKKLVEPIAEKRVDQIIASLPEKDKKMMEGQRDLYVEQMQRQLALNPKFIKEMSGAAAQKREVLAMIENIEGQMNVLNKQLQTIKRSVE